MLREVLIYFSVYVGLFAVTYYFLSFLSSRGKTKKVFEGKLPKVSLIIPAYNEEQGISDTIMSALGLDYPEDELEVMVVDDGSKDRTYEIAKKIKNKRLRVFTKENGGKATALNYGIARARGEIVVTMDADTFAEKDALRKMVKYFSNSRVMCVTPSITVHKPKGILGRIQQIEYLLGVYLRKAFAGMNAIHVTPGAFSLYRKSFFKKYGGFEVGNITEDMEMALRIQFNHFVLECAEDAVVYTVSPKTFVSLLKQRRRWYFGLTKNFLKYKKMFSRKYRELGLIVLPTAVTTILLSTFLTAYLVIDSLIRLKRELVLLKSINFDFSNLFTFNKFVFERYFLLLFSDPTFLFLVLFILILLGYMFFAKSKVKKYSNIKLSLWLFIVFYSFLFAFWWIVSLFYVIFIGRISWGKQ